jgi:toxin FitB
MIIVDTNIISELMRREPTTAVVDWLNTANPDMLWTSTIVTMEVRYGLECMPAGKRRSVLTSAFEDMVELLFAERILDFDEAASRITASLMARRKLSGITIDLRDSMIAGMALSRRAVLATRNVRHFADVAIQIVNPFETLQDR